MSRRRRPSGRSHRAVLVACLSIVVLGLTACGGVNAGRHVQSTRLTLIGAADDGAVFLSWSPRREARSYRVLWRPSSAHTWTSMTLGVVDHALISGLANGVPYDFTIEAETSDGPVRSVTARVTPKRRSACAYRTYHPVQSFFCTQTDADAWM